MRIHSPLLHTAKIARHVISQSSGVRTPSSWLHAFIRTVRQTAADACRIATGPPLVDPGGACLGDSNCNWGHLKAQLGRNRVSLSRAGKRACCAQTLVGSWRSPIPQYRTLVCCHIHTVLRPCRGEARFS